MNRTKRRGFTLVEVVVTVAIIGILLAVAIPNMTGYRKNAERNGCRDQMHSILSAIEEARLERDLDMIDTENGALVTEKKIDKLVEGTGDDKKNKYLPEYFECPSGGAYTVDYDAEHDKWTVTCPNGHTL